MAGAGYRTFQSGEVLTSTNVQTYLMDQAVQVYAGTAARASAVPSPSTGMVAYSTATGLQVFDGSAWTDVGGVGYGVATGGASTATITVGSDSYQLLTFTSDSNLVVSTAGLFDVYMVGGGGGSGFGYSSGTGGGGGGAGGLLVQTIYLSATSHQVSIGAGGAGGTNSVTTTGKIGFGSSIGSSTEGVQIAGGAGGWGYTQGSGPGAGANGAGGQFPSQSGSSPLTPIGFAGGAGDAGNGGAGGGGGHTGAGGDAVAGVGGAGGAGQSPSTFTGGDFTTTIGVGGAGGNATGSAAAVAGGANTGDGAKGAGGGAINTNGAAGGSGRIFVRFKI